MKKDCGLRIVDCDSQVSRRDFVRAGLRYGSLAVLLGGGVILASRRESAETPECLRKLPCDRCSAWDGCSLPQAQAARREIETGGANERQ